MREVFGVRWLRMGALISAAIGAASAGFGAARAADVDPAQRASYARSTDGGRSFTLAPLDDVGLGLEMVQVAAAGGVVHGLFADGTDFAEFPRANPGFPGPARLHYRRSTDGGRSFAPSVRLDRGDGQSSEAALALGGDVVHAAWVETPAEDRPGDILAVAGSEERSGFPEPANVTSTADLDEHDPALALDGDLLALAYEAEATDGSGRDVQVRMGGQGRVEFGPPVVVTPDSPGRDEDEPAVGIAGRNVVVAYRQSDAKGEPTKTMWARSTDGGRTFSRGAALPGGAGDNTPAVHMEGSEVHVLACDQEDPDVAGGGEDELLHWRSDDGGATFADAVVLSRQPCAKVAVDGSGDILHVAYQGDVAGTPDIFHAASTDGGRSWSRFRNVSANFASSADPSISIDARRPDQVHIAWTDETGFLFSVSRPVELPRARGGFRRFSPQDVVRFTGGGFAMVLDGSDVGLPETAPGIDALAAIQPAEPPSTPDEAVDGLVLSFDEPVRLPGLGRVDDSDLVRFEPARLGERSAGRFSMFLAGAEIGLHHDAEDVDAVEVDGSDVHLSTEGAFSLGGALSGGGEDIVVCRRRSARRCEAPILAFNGSRRGLEAPEERIDAFSFGADGNGPGEEGVFSTPGPFAAGSASGGRADLFSCVFPERDPDAPDSFDGGLADCGTDAAPLATTFVAATYGLDANITALDVDRRELAEREPPS
ncbi:MAG: hypothetical protein ACRDY7_16850 [Acidimicrobiia bacterium]